MTPAHTDSPLRRSEAGVFRDGAQNQQRPVHNDDEEERRQARRRTLLTSGSETDASTLEQSETLKKCLEIFHENKLSRDNAWSLSLIDTVSTLLERHHKSLNNFTVCGSSLEASSKVYGLRVDSVHTDVLRMSAGLNARKFRGNDAGDGDAEDDVATGGEGGADPNGSAGIGDDPQNAANAANKNAKKKRQRKPVATITKNKETINGRLDTVPLQDPVFGKLNSITGSINASNRLMNNMLHTVNSELRLRMTHKFWDAESTADDCDYTQPVPLDMTNESDLLPCERLCKFERFEKLLLRPENSGYIISDTPEESNVDKNIPDASRSNYAPIEDDGGGGGGGGGGEATMFANGAADSSMAFDMNAICDPMPDLGGYAPVIAVDEHDFDDYTAEEHSVIGNCRGLRKAPVVIEDMRPVDSTTNLEYSYRPVEKISQFWAGPSHWRFRRTRHRSSAIAAQSVGGNTVENVGRTLHARNRRQNAAQAKKRLKVEFAAPIHDAQFILLDDKYKGRKTNIPKKWDQRKLRLPTDLKLNAEQLVNRRIFAPAFAVFQNENNIGLALDADDDDTEASSPPLIENEHHFNNDDDDGHISNADVFHPNDALSNTNQLLPVNANITDRAGLPDDVNENLENENNRANETILEIATDFEGAPRQVTKIIVPFAKRAKVIDMKSLKRSCSQLITQQMRQCTLQETEMPQHPIVKNESYAPGVASFKKTYEQLPSLLSSQMAEGLSTSIALYSVLHLANDLNFRLIPQDDLDDFLIRQVAND